MAALTNYFPDANSRIIVNADHHCAILNSDSASQRLRTVCFPIFFKTTFDGWTRNRNL